MKAKSAMTNDNAKCDTQCPHKILMDLSAVTTNT